MSTDTVVTEVVITIDTDSTMSQGRRLTLHATVSGHGTM
jgi:hypothetical protein